MTFEDKARMVEKITGIAYEECLRFIRQGKVICCPHCGSQRDPFVDPGTEKFEPRRGCLDCNQWWEPVRLKEP